VVDGPRDLPPMDSLLCFRLWTGASREGLLRGREGSPREEAARLDAERRSRGRFERTGTRAGRTGRRGLATREIDKWKDLPLPVVPIDPPPLTP
jgi:hypothetical protein